MAELGHTQTPVTTANTNLDGSGTLTKIYEVTADAGAYVFEVICYPLGTNNATQAAVIATDQAGLGQTDSNYLVGLEALPATVAGTVASGDVVTFTVKKWFPKGTVFHALVYATQAAGRQFVAYSGATYEPDVLVI